MSQHAGRERRSLSHRQRSPVQDALYSTLRLIGRHVEGFFGAIAAFLTVGLVLAAGAVSIFAILANAVLTGWTQAFDESALHWFAQHRTTALDKVMIEITSLGTGVVLIMIVAIAALFLWLTNHRWSAYVLLIGVLGGKLVNTALKGIFDRPRPSVVDWVTDVYSPSFPSGHAMSSMVVYGSVAYLVGRLEPSPRLRRAIWVLATLVILAIGVSRMYLGVHYPSDVIGGYIAGFAWIALVASTLAALRFFADRRPETRREEEDLTR